MMPSHLQQYHPGFSNMFLPPLVLTPMPQQVPSVPTQKTQMQMQHYQPQFFYGQQQQQHQMQYYQYQHQLQQQYHQQQLQRRASAYSFSNRLTRANVMAIDSKDSRQARWHRVLSYVASVRSSYASNYHGKDMSDESSAMDSISSWISEQEHIVATPPDEDFIGAAAQTTKKVKRSLWDGGSCGTDGVDQFIWDDELDSGGNRFTLPPRSQQGEYVVINKSYVSSPEQSPRIFSFEGCPTASSSESRRRAMEVDNDDPEQRPSKRQRSCESLTAPLTMNSGVVSSNSNAQPSNQIRVTNSNISKTHALALEQYLETLRAIEKSRLPVMKTPADYDFAGFGAPERWRQTFGVAA